MNHSTAFFVSDDPNLVEKFKSFCELNNVTPHSYTSENWKTGLTRSGFINNLYLGAPSLSSGNSPLEVKSNVINFPTAQPQAASPLKVSTMNEMESQAITNAIGQYRGNLTEAARALGIGRATLYRKVKQYNINPNEVRRKKAA